MVSYKNYDIQTNTADFVADTEAECDNWPTTSASGSAELSWMKSIGHGSTGFVIETSKAYMLGEDGWEEI